MDMNSIRRKNLRAVINARTKGSVAQFARDTGIDEARLSQVLSEKYRNGKNFGEKSARSIESAAGLALLSLDALEPTSSATRGKLQLISTRQEPFDQNAL